MKRPQRKIVASTVLAAFLIGVLPTGASAHECEAKGKSKAKRSSFHSKGNSKGHCRAKK